MSSVEKTQGGSGDELMTFEELPEVKDQDKGNTGEQVDAAGYKKPGYEKPDYGCPQGQKFDKDLKKCVPIKKEGEGTEDVDFAKEKGYKCKAGEVYDEAKGKCVPISEASEYAREKGYKCGAGEVWDDKKGKCVPVKEALSERDTQIVALSTKVSELSNALGAVQAALRSKNIEAVVDSQIQAGHVAPAQRGKVISFLEGIPDEKHSDLLGIFSRQKFPLATETSSQESKKPTGEGAEEPLTDEKKKELRKKFEIDKLVGEHGVKP